MAIGIAIVAGQLLAYLALRTRYRVYRIPSAAMAPTIQPGDRVLVRRTNEVAAGDLAAFVFPGDQQTQLLKRIVATGGDTVQIRSKHLFVNGNELSEPYAFFDDPQSYPDQPALPEPYRSRDHFGPLRVPPNHYFVLGDNRDHSHDSRYWGTVPAENILGRVILIYSRGSFRRVSRPPASSRIPPARPPE